MNKISAHREKLQLPLLVLAVAGLSTAGWSLCSFFNVDEDEGQNAAVPTGQSHFAVEPIFFDDKHADVVSAGQATDIPDGEYVIGIEVNGAAKAYPISVMGLELANDVLGGEPIAVSW